MEIESYVALIEAVLDEPITNLRIIDKGWTNLVFDVNDTWIFRFVRNADSKQIAIEKDFLPNFSKRSPITIPTPVTFKNSANSSGLNYLVYPKIHGERLSQGRLDGFTLGELELLCKSLGNFLSSLHQSKFQHPNLLAYPYGGSDFWNDLWPLVSPLLNKKSKEKALAYFTETIELLEQSPIRQTLTHSDLGPNNMLLDASKNTLAGIIDFGDIALADPAIDFSSFYRNFGRQFVENILQHYTAPSTTPSTAPSNDNFMLRIDYQSKRKLFFVTYFAMNYGFEKAVPDQISVIEAMF